MKCTESGFVEGDRGNGNVYDKPWTDDDDADAVLMQAASPCIPQNAECCIWS